MNPNHRYSRYFTYIQPVLKIPIVKSYGGIIINLLALSVFIIFAIKPTVETILVLQKRLEDSNKVLEEISQKSENLSIAKRSYSEMDSSIKAKVQTAVPTSVSLKTLTTSLENIALNNEASISALQIQPLTIRSVTSSSMDKKLQELSFTYNVEGSYASLVNILKDLQETVRVISIDSLILNKTDVSSNLLMSVTGKAYYLE